MFIAFNTKGTVILVAPVFLFYIFKDIQKGRFLFWKKTSLFGSVLFLTYFLVTKALAGSFFRRFEAINSNSYVNARSYDMLGREVLINRLPDGFINLMLEELLIVSLLVAIVALLINAFRFRNEKITFYATSIIILILLMNFMTISLSSYNPVCLLPRHMLLITPIVSICTVKLIIQMFYSAEFNKIRIRQSILIVTLLILNIPTLKYANYCRGIEYREFKKEFKSMLDDKQITGNLYGSKVFENMGNYFLGFMKRENLRIETYEQMEQSDGPFEEGILIENWYTEWHAGLPDDYVNKLFDENRLITESHKQNAKYDHFTLHHVVNDVEKN